MGRQVPELSPFQLSVLVGKQLTAPFQFFVIRVVSVLLDKVGDIHLILLGNHKQICEFCGTMNSSLVR